MPCADGRCFAIFQRFRYQRFASAFFAAIDADAAMRAGFHTPDFRRCFSATPLLILRAAFAMRGFTAIFLHFAFPQP